jgi:hypothetical protein
MIVVLVLPPLLAAGWWGVLSTITSVERAEFGSSRPGDLEKAMEKYEKYLKSRP